MKYILILVSAFIIHTADCNEGTEGSDVPEPSIDDWCVTSQDTCGRDCLDWQVPSSYNNDDEAFSSELVCIIISCDNGSRAKGCALPCETDGDCKYSEYACVTVGTSSYCVGSP